MKGERGVCPGCHALGAVAEPCRESSCRKAGLHLIPAKSFQKRIDQPEAFRDPLVGRCLDEYLLIDKLGKGGFGRVYLALQVPLSMKAAVKVLLPRKGRPAVEAADLECLEVEGRALARLNHPNIVKMLGFRDTGELPYLAMEYVPDAVALHEALWERSIDQDWFSPGEALGILEQVLFALEAAHGQNVLHGDINPNNILMQAAVGYPRLVRLVDFGLGRLLDDGSEETSAGIFGTDVYIAPETITGDAIGPWTDLYGVAVLAHVLLLREQPFRADGRRELLAIKADHRIDPAAGLIDRGCTDQTVRFFRQALAVKPKQRYARAFDLRTDLYALVESIEAD